MIGSLRGVLAERGPGAEVLIEVGGVGYRVLASAATLAALGPAGSPAFVYVHHHLREDHQTLYGFATRDERDAFEALLGAHGVGPALALAILGALRPEALRRAVAEGDAGALRRVPGVGAKTAARLLVELEHRLEPADGAADGSGPGATGGPEDTAVGADARAEVRAALASLGYGPDEVRDAVAGLPEDGDAQTLLRLALRRAGRVPTR